MNRTDRLYAIVEELRAASPYARSARRLAAHFEVSVRTIERDLDALLQAGLPIWAQKGRTGGYVLDPEFTLPPVNLSPQEAIALAVAARYLDGSPFQRSAQSAVAKLLAVMPERSVREAAELAGRVTLIMPLEPVSPVPRVIEEAIADRRVLHLEYLDRSGQPSRRSVEPLGFVGNAKRWYLLGWCRLRDGVRVFRLDRVQRVFASDELSPPRAIKAADCDIPAHLVSTLTLPAGKRSANTDRTVSSARPRLVSIGADRA
jgi:predicted DNA-binding transcriptional regulator YafY